MLQLKQCPVIILWADQWPPQWKTQSKHCVTHVESIHWIDFTHAGVSPVLFSSMLVSKIEEPLSKRKPLDTVCPSHFFHGWGFFLKSARCQKLSYTALQCEYTADHFKIYTNSFWSKNYLWKQLEVTNRNKSKYLNWGRSAWSYQAEAFSSLFWQRPAERRVCAQGRGAEWMCAGEADSREVGADSKRGVWNAERERKKERAEASRVITWAVHVVHLALVG